MQKTIYMCDQCQQDMGKKTHISANFTNYSGVFELAKDGRWGTKKSLQGTFLHFCNGKCIGAYFSNLMKPVAKTKK